MNYVSKLLPTLLNGWPKLSSNFPSLDIHIVVHDLNFSITSFEHELSQPSCTIFSNSSSSNQEFSNLKLF